MDRISKLEEDVAYLMRKLKEPGRAGPGRVQIDRDQRDIIGDIQIRKGSVRGQLLRDPEHADITGASNFSTTTTGSWVTITANSKTLQIVITPDTDCRIEVILSGLVNHSNVSAGVYLGIDVNGANVKHALAHNPGVSIFHEKLVTHEFAATAGTTYTITGKTLTSTAGTVTVNQDAAATELYIKVFKRP